MKNLINRELVKLQTEPTTPFAAQWPGRFLKNSESDAIVCCTNIFVTLAETSRDCFLTSGKERTNT